MGGFSDKGFPSEHVNLQKYSRKTKGWKIPTRFDTAV